MKKFVIVFSALILIFTTVFFASCSSGSGTKLVSTKGTKFTTTLYSVTPAKKEKLGEVTETVDEVVQKGDSIVITSRATGVLENYDKGGLDSVSYLHCTRFIKENYYVAMKNNCNVFFQTMEDPRIHMKITDYLMEYPSDLHENQKLSGGDFTRSIQDSIGKETSIVFRIQDRKSAKKKSVTTPAGTWECFEISYEIHFLNETGMDLGYALHKEWYNPEVGIVRTEIYANSKEKLSWYSELTAMVHE